MGRVLSRLVVPIVVGFAIGGPVAAAAGATPVTSGQWQHSIGHVPAPGRGCYHASYPALKWIATPCTVAPHIPIAPVSGAGSPLLWASALAPVSGSPSRRASPLAPVTNSTPPREPETVGNGTSFSAVVSGTIYQATGSFNDVSPGITETGQFDDQGPQVANEFTLQLNSQFFSSSPACSGSSDPANCLGWQQFIYEAPSNFVFMQYWLIDYDATCPAGWFTVNVSPNVDCYTNSPASTYSGNPLTAADLASVNLVGSANANGNDQVSLSVGSGTATMVSNSDDMVDLANFWNTTEFDVFGDGGGGQANFGSNSTLEAQTTLVASSQQAPSCVQEGFTAETNNLTRTGTPALGTEQSPTIAFAQTNGATTTPSCATAAGTGPIQTATGLSVAPSSPATNQPVTLTATVTPSAFTPSGTVAFDNNGVAIPGCAAQPLAVNGSSYTATCGTSFTAASSPESLSGTFTPSSGSLGPSTSAIDNLAIARDSTATSLGASTGRPVVNQSVTFTATVTPTHSGSAFPSGSVEFLDGNFVISACSNRPLSGSAASCTVSYPSPGSHSITATYLGDANFTSSTSSGQNVAATQPVPANSSPPTISGKTTQGQTLKESHGSWSNSPISYSYQWEDCDRSGANCSSIPGAVSQTHKLGSADVGHTIRLLETARNAGGAGIPARSGATAVIAAKSPTRPTRAQVMTAIKSVLAPSGKAARITAILKAGGYTYRFGAPSAGTLTLDWYAKVKGRKVLVAVTSRLIHSAGKAPEKLKLTRRGRTLLKTLRKVTIFSTARFGPTGSTSTTATRRFTLKR
jgi:Bacterial Ig-like domain (group 3)